MAKALMDSMVSSWANNLLAFGSGTPDEGTEDHKHAHMLRKNAWSGRPNTSAETSCGDNLVGKVRKCPA